ncbi:MAG TPA: CIA30 family protein [Kiritimatiellia bacterium]|nr:CIA30 family protein [Kiritimatiellia bacterium]HPA78809.1 CIA30 family protein [Kiritimatiellia bacterium]
MKIPILLALTGLLAGCGSGMVLHQFSTHTGPGNWQIENDSVMGGLSRGRLAINKSGHALFTGEISLDNNGGFSSIQADFESLDVSAFRRLCIRLKGDGKRYQVRIESAPKDRHAYAFDFSTCGKWQVISIPFDQMFAIRHGDRLDLPNYPGQTLSRIQILAGDGRAESFQLEIDRIWLQ